MSNQKKNSKDTNPISVSRITVFDEYLHAADKSKKKEQTRPKSSFLSPDLLSGLPKETSAQFSYKDPRSPEISPYSHEAYTDFLNSLSADEFMDLISECDTCHNNEIFKYNDERLINMIREREEEISKYVEKTFINLPDPYSFQTYGLNPLKNILLNDRDTTFKASSDSNELYDIMLDLMYNADNPVTDMNMMFIGDYAMFAIKLDGTYIAFKVDHYDNDKDEYDITIDKCKEDNSFFAIQDAVYSFVGYGLIMEIEPDVWKII